MSNASSFFLAEAVNNSLIPLKNSLVKINCGRFINDFHQKTTTVAKTKLILSTFGKSFRLAAYRGKISFIFHQKLWSFFGENRHFLAHSSQNSFRLSYNLLTNELYI